MLQNIDESTEDKKLFSTIQNCKLRIMDIRLLIY